MKTLTVDNYYEDDEYMSVSAFKKLKNCEVDGKTVYDESNKTDAMMVGSYVDAFVEGTLDKFKEENPSIFSSRGTTKGELKSEYRNADLICEFIKNDKHLQQFLSGQKQTIMTGEIGGIPFKIKMDAYSPSIAICDLKVMKTITDSKGNFIDFITPWGYDIQMACYQEIVRQNTGEQLPCYICAVTKESPINSAIIHIPQDMLNTALYTVESEIQHLYDVKMGKVEPIGCGVCNTCITKRATTPIISLGDILGIGGSYGE
jgi:hypothetical protein